MRRSIPLFVALVLACAGAPASAGTTRTVQIKNVEFLPRTLSVPLGTTVRWSNQDPVTHTSTANRTYPGGWDRTMDPGENYARAFRLAGTFRYYCEPHSDGTNGMVGRIKVPVKATPSSGGNSTTFTVMVGSAAPPAGWAFEVQRRIGSGPWRTIKNRLERRSFGYRSAKDGTHRFRARLERTSGSVVHAWSPADSVAIR